MKYMYIFLYLMSSLLYLQCNVPRKPSEETIFKSGRFDIDSNLVVSYPSNLNFTSYLKYPSYEVRYYLRLFSKDKQEYMLIQRLKFKGEKLNKKERTDNFTNSFYTGLYERVNLLKQNEKQIKGRCITSLLFCTKQKNKIFYPFITFFYNSDSSFTVIEFRTKNTDSLNAMKCADHILNSIDFVEK